MVLARANFTDRSVRWLGFFSSEWLCATGLKKLTRTPTLSKARTKPRQTEVKPELTAVGAIKNVFATIHLSSFMNTAIVIQQKLLISSSTARLKPIDRKHYGSRYPAQSLILRWSPAPAPKYSYWWRFVQPSADHVVHSILNPP